MDYSGNAPLLNMILASSVHNSVSGIDLIPMALATLEGPIVAGTLDSKA